MADFTEDVTKVINTVVEKAKEYGGSAKIQALIKAEEAKKHELYYRLGRKYYELYKDAPASDLSEIMEKLLTCDDKIDEYKKALKDARDAKYTEVSEPDGTYTDLNNEPEEAEEPSETEEPAESTDPSEE